MAKRPDWALPGPERFFKTKPGVVTVPNPTNINPNSGRTAGGLAVTITGTNFAVNGNGSSPSVLFDGVPATNVVVVSDTQITCVSPAHADSGVVDVVVVRDTQSGTLPGLFTFFESFVTKVSPAYGVLAGGVTVMLEGFNFQAGSTVFFGSNAATGVNVIDSQHIICVTPNHSIGFVDITIVDPSGTTVARNAFQFTLLTRGDDIRRTPGINIRDVLSNAPNTCTFTVDGASNVPTIGEKIEIVDSEDGNRRLFAGTVQTIEQVYEGQTDQLAWNVTCVDFTWLFNRIRPSGSFNAVPADQVVRALVASFAPGFTVNHVQTNLAKVTAIFDGTDDFVTVMSKLADAIGGGHFKIDYDQDVHFFHTPPIAAVLPPTQFANLGAHCTIAAGAAIASTTRYTIGHYFLRHTFVFSDGSESAFGSISNILTLDGTKQINVSGIPLGPNPGGLTCVARRLYYNAFLPAVINGAMVFSSIEQIQRYVEIPDNTTTAFNSDFGSTNPSVAGITDIATTVPIPSLANTGHPTGPVSAPTAVADIISGVSGFFSGGTWQFKVAYIYRDGSVSFPSPPSNTAGVPHVINGTAVIGNSLYGIPIGPDLNGNDVVGRIIYFCAGLLQDPNFSVSYSGSAPDPLGAIGAVWPIPILDPTWADGVAGDVVVIPDNTTDRLEHFAFLPLGFNVASVSSTTTTAFQQYYTDTPAIVGFGQKIYNNGSVLSSDPIPVWPNNDGPSLEDTDVPADLTDDNPDLLHEDSGSQPFRVMTDLSQIRNRVEVRGSGSVATLTAAVGDVQLYVGDIASFSPSGGTVLVVDPGTLKSRVMGYNGVGGVVGKAFIILKTALTVSVVQGSTVRNFYQADNVDSQKFLAKIELDKDGLPTDGVHEFIIDDPNLKAAFQLYMRAHAELERYSWPIVTVKYATRDPDTKSGKMVHVDMTNPPCQGDFLIQDVTIDQIRDEGEQLAPRYTATASSMRYDLNDLLLQLVGGQIGNSSGATSSGGLVQAAFSQSTAVTPASASAATTVLNSAGTRAFWMTGISNDSKFTMGVAVSEIIPGVSSFVNDKRANWHTCATTAGAGSQVEISQSAPCSFDHSPLTRIRFRTGPDISNLRLFLTQGIGTPSNQNPQTNASLRSVGIMLDANTGSFVGFTWDGLTQLTTPLLAAAASTEYLCEISTAYIGNPPSAGAGTATISLTVVGGTKTSISMALNSRYSGNNPSRITASLDLYATTASARSVDWTIFYTEFGSSM